MMLLYVPSANVQLPREFLSDQTFYESRLFEAAYSERFWEISDAIAARGVGMARIGSIIKRLQDRLPRRVTDFRSGLQLLEHAMNEAERRSIAKAIGEWADGDMVASHIASCNDLLCTDDRGKSAGGPSIFDDANRFWLKATYAMNIVDVREPATRIAG